MTSKALPYSVVLLLAVLLPGCADADKTNRQMLIGVWQREDEQGRWVQKLRADDTCEMDLEERRAAGTWRLHKNVLTLSFNRFYVNGELQNPDDQTVTATLVEVTPAKLTLKSEKGAVSTFTRLE